MNDIPKSIKSPGFVGGLETIILIIFLVALFLSILP